MYGSCVDSYSMSRLNEEVGIFRNVELILYD